MYFWRIDNLKAELASRPMADREALPYFIVDSGFTTLAIALPGSSFNLWDVMRMTWGIALAVFGTIYIFRQNGGSQGQQFLPRVLAVSWVVGVRWCVWVIPVYVVCLMTGLFEAETNILEFLFDSITDTVLVRLIAAHIRDVAQRSPASDPLVQPM